MFTKEQIMADCMYLRENIVLKNDWLEMVEAIESDLTNPNRQPYFRIHWLAQLIRQIDRIPGALTKEIKKKVCDKDYGIYFQLFVILYLAQFFEVTAVEKKISGGSSIDVVIKVDGHAVNCHIGQIDQSNKADVNFQMLCAISSQAFNEHREIGIKDIDGVIADVNINDLKAQIFANYPIIPGKHEYHFKNQRNPMVDDVITITFAQWEECSTGNISGIDHLRPLDGKLKDTRGKIIMKIPDEVHIFIGVSGFIESIRPVDLQAYQLDGIFFFSKPSTPDLSTFQSYRTKLQIRDDSPHKSVLEVLDEHLPMSHEFKF